LFQDCKIKPANLGAHGELLDVPSLRRDDLRVEEKEDRERERERERRR